MDAAIRLARPADGEAVQAIYAPFVTDSAVSFETVTPSVPEMRDRIESTLPKRPWLVCETEDGDVRGYAKAGTLRDGTAYRWTVELTVYVEEDVQGHGVGTALYETLIALLAAQGYRTAYALVTNPNTESEGLHERFEFTRIGTFPGFGYKCGSWWDVQCWYRELNELESDPEAPVSLDDLEDEVVDTACANGTSRLASSSN